MAQVNQWVQVVSFINKPYPATDKRKAGVLGIVDALLFTEGGETKTGELLLPADHPPVEKNGVYSLEMVLAKTFDGKLIGKVARLLPYSPQKAAAAK